ncbi:MAG TPA: histidine kinase, partial [Clostridiales bacterium]|nr:histidine kinase [Clostridiales bacterium]
ELKPVDYTNLSGGEYFFKMQLLDVYGEVQQEISVRIVKKESLREATWFRAFIILGFVGVVIVLAYLASYQRMKKLKAKEQEQTLLIREIVEAFAKVIDMKDRYTNGHSTRVAEYTEMLARELGYDDETVEKYRNIALLHDIGKVGISSETLNKPGRLTDEEFKEIKSHSGKGYNVLKNISIMPELAIGARDHHERPDGRGYPRGITGDEIPRVAQIIAVADTFDAMYSDRPYRKRMNFEKTISIIKEVSGTQLAEDVVEAFLRLVEKGEFRAEDDNGGGSTEDITNIHKKQDADKAAQDRAAKKSSDADEGGENKENGDK